MTDKKISPLWVGVIAFIFVVVSVAVSWRLLNGDSSLLRQATIQYTQISPNADGIQDATLVAYELSRNAVVSIFFENEAGERFYFRRDKPRGVGEYQVLFSGVVDGYRLTGEDIQGEILSRLLQDGTYTWTVMATDHAGVTEQMQGQLMIVEADTTLPEMRDFSLDKVEFTPNRDGIDDRVLIQFFLVKDVNNVRVFLVTKEGLEIPISELERDVPAGIAGRHYYDYEGGVDNGETPPDDGTYDIVAIAEDLEGQKIRVSDQLTINFGGVPRADIFAPPSGNTLDFEATAVALCDTVQFTLTVQNYGNTPIRTTGPTPGTIYDSDWNYNTLGWHTESGAWRVAIGYENEITNYPYRWAVGDVEDLEEIDGHYYLMPGERAVITGGIRVTGRFGDRNPQPLWAGLIHEDVEISEFNTHVDAQDILVDLPDENNRQPCETREIPRKIEE